MERSLAELCQLLEGELIGDGSIIIRGLGDSKVAQPDELVFAEDTANIDSALRSQAGALIVSQQISDLKGRDGIRVKNPRVAFTIVLDLFYPETKPPLGIHPSAILGNDVQLADGVSVGPHAVLGDRVKVGKNTLIGANVTIGDDVSIGEDSVIDANATLYRRSVLGSRVYVRAGVRIGADGFGYVFDAGKHLKVPQVGNVVIEDDVEIGANSCIDRATIGSTVIGQGTKIDNMVQVAHNNQIGQHVILCGQVGLAGSVRVDNYAMLGGKAGAIDHVHIGQAAKLGAGSIATKTITAGSEVWGTPARDGVKVIKQLAALSRLPEALKALAGSLKRLEKVEKRLEER